MTHADHRMADGQPRMKDESIGQLLSDATRDISELVRKEMQLAKLEMREEARKASKAGGKLGAAAVVGYLALLLFSFALVWGLSELANMDVGWSFLIFAVLYGIGAAVLFTSGRKQLRTVSPVPRQTVETLKEDAEWARAQTK